MSHHRQPSRLIKWNRIILIALLVWVPIAYGSNSRAYEAIFMLFIGLAGVLWTISLHRHPKQFKFSKISVYAVSLLVGAQLWVLLQVLLGISIIPSYSLHQLVLGLSYSLFFTLILSHFNNRHALTLLISALFVSGLIQAVYGIFMTQPEFAHLLGKEVDSRANGSFVNRNHLAGYLEMTIALGIGLVLAFRDGRKWSFKSFLDLLLSAKLQIRLAIILMVIALVMTYSRMGNTAFVTSLIITSSIFILVTQKNRVRNIVLLASFIVIDVLVISQFFGLDKLKERLESTEITITQTDHGWITDINDARGLILKDSIELGKQEPIWGIGPGTYKDAFMPYTDPKINPLVDHAHNDYIEFWIEYGLIGTLLLALLVLLSLSNAIKSINNSQSFYRSGVGFGATMGIIAILIHSFTDFNLQIPSNALTFLTVCAIAILSQTHPKPVKKKSRRRKRKQRLELIAENNKN